jgi:hypothetical protein
MEKIILPPAASEFIKDFDTYIRKNYSILDVATTDEKIQFIRNMTLALSKYYVVFGITDNSGGYSKEINYASSNASIGIEIKTFDYWLNIIFNEKEFFSTLEKMSQKDEVEYKRMLNDLRTTYEHEMIHNEQFKRNYAKSGVKGFAGKEKLEKKFGGEEHSYFHKRSEQMAHAETTVNQLMDLGYSREQILDMIRKENHTLLKLSKSYNNFYNNLHDKYPKDWKKYLKYLKDYCVSFW